MDQWATGVRRSFWREYWWIFAGAGTATLCLVAMVLSGLHGRRIRDDAKKAVEARHAEEEEQRALREEAHRADEKRAHFARLDERDRTLREACGGAAVKHASESEIRTACHLSVKDELKSPRKAKFVDGAFASDGCITTYESSVDATNSFGAEQRHRFSCRYDPRTARVAIAWRR